MSGSKSSAPETADQPVSLTVHSAPQPDKRTAMTRRGRWQALAVIVICAMPVLASYYSFYVLRLSGSAYSQLIMPTKDIPEALQLSALDGAKVTAESLKGQWLLVAVQPSACDQACDAQLFMQRQLREMLGKERDKLDKLWLIPDGEPLRPELQQVISQGVPLRALRVPKAQLEAWLQPQKGHQLREHLYLVDPMGRWMMRTPVDPDPGKIKRDLDRLMKANAGWDKPGR
ncbi:hypothetical protein [Pelomonas sp. SE-A7]|uniref:SCO family protein n=1 Tax=Pelomonas sp. SE-A7 TaxID=3054953 RepID=UPI00259CBEB1|nr:hypothetical protein [Pelomonas sp. SE-A7]MDM4767581.1 hypothetical protein [Pelomonas sp. SE-A7]